VNRNQPLVCRAQDVGLRQPGPVGGGGSLSEREERGEGLDGEVRHCFQHRHFDVTAARGAAPLHQGCEDALRGIKTRDCIGKRGTQELGPAVIDYHA